MANQEIKCSVSSCKHNSKQSMCDLNQIEVGKQKTSPTTCKDTECASFECI